MRSKNGAHIPYTYRLVAFCYGRHDTRPMYTNTVACGSPFKQSSHYHCRSSHKQGLPSLFFALLSETFLLAYVPTPFLHLCMYHGGKSHDTQPGFLSNSHAHCILSCIAPSSLLNCHICSRPIIHHRHSSSAFVGYGEERNVPARDCSRLFMFVCLHYPAVSSR